MPLDFKIEVSDYQEVAVWKITEEIDQLKSGLSLNKQEQIELDSIKHEKGKMQWLAVRQLARQILQTGDQILYTENGVPYLKHGDFHLSISHSEERVALSCNQKYETGIDIQFSSDKIESIQSKFASDWELSWIGEEAKSDYLHLLWSAKEALFKYYTTEMPFKEAEVQSFVFKKSGTIEAVRKRENFTDIFQLTYRTFDNYYLVYLSELISIEYGTQTHIKEKRKG
ncbi:MAG: 4'-phosphopantetheinyl transferase superfamily protein [Bacteroidota bacterium]